MRPRAAVSLGLVIVLPLLLVSWCTVRDKRLEARFRTISTAMSPSQVINIMGTPAWEGRCGAKMPTGLPSQCKTEMGYEVTLAPLEPSYYLIWFGNDGRVVETAPITSP